MKYGTGAAGLDQATFAVEREDFVFMIGSTGSGKSTVMRLLIKELEPTEGTIRVAGRDLSTITRKQVPFYRRNIGVVFQDFKLLPNRTVYDNVAYALQVTGHSRKEIRAKVPDILRLTGLSTKLHNYPDQLSGGEQQRVSIARAFVNHPPLLLADEPTGNLDPETSIDIMRLLYRINRTGTTVLVATHDHAMVDKMRRRVLELSRRTHRPRRGHRPLRARRVDSRVRSAPARPGESPRSSSSDEHSLGFFFRESLRAMRRNAAPSFAALATVTVTLIVVGVFIPIVQATRGAADSVRSRVLVDVYMKSNATAADDARVLKELKALPNVRKVVFESKAQALAAGEEDRTRWLTRCSPATRCRTRSTSIRRIPADALQVRAAINGSGPGGSGNFIDPSIGNVSNHTEDTEKLLTVTRFVTITAALLAALLTLASIVLIGNTIRLSLFARRREIEVMKLVGATDWFIRWPFVIEGMIVGAFGAVAAIVVLGVTKLALLDPLASNWTLIAAPRTIPFVPLMLVLVGAGVAVSALGSGISLRRFLRV